MTRPGQGKPQKTSDALSGWRVLPGQRKGGVPVRHLYPILCTFDDAPVGWTVEPSLDTTIDFYWRWQERDLLACKWNRRAEDCALDMGAIALLCNGDVWVVTSKAPPAAIVAEVLGGRETPSALWSMSSRSDSSTAEEPRRTSSER